MHNKSPHILNTSSNLLGFSFLVLASIKGFGLPQANIIDEIVSLLVIIFAVSCVLSFVSMRMTSEKRSLQFETLADFVFLGGLVLTVILAFLLATDILMFTK